MSNFVSVNKSLHIPEQLNLIERDGQGIVWIVQDSLDCSLHWQFIVEYFAALHNSLATFTQHGAILNIFMVEHFQVNILLQDKSHSSDLINHSTVFTALQLHKRGIVVSICPSVCQTRALWQNESTWRKKFNYD